VPRVEPLASLDREEIVARVGPVIQHYLTGELDGDPIRTAAAHCGWGSAG